MNQQDDIDAIIAKVNRDGYAHLGHFHGMGCHGTYGQTLDTCEVTKTGKTYRITRTHERGSAESSWTLTKGRYPRKLIAEALADLRLYNEAEDARHRAEIGKVSA